MILPIQSIRWHSGQVIEGCAPSSASRKIYDSKGVFVGTLEGFTDGDEEFILNAANNRPQKGVKELRDELSNVLYMLRTGATKEQLDIRLCDIFRLIDSPK